MPTRTVRRTEPAQSRPKGLIGLKDLPKADLLSILELARQLKKTPADRLRALAPLKGKRVLTLFIEPSTRTKTSFQIAARTLGADVVDFSPSASSLTKGESLKDTALALERMGIDAIIMRHQASGAPVYLSRLVKPPIVNAGDGMNEHPTQAILDLFTIRESLGQLDKLHVVIVGDILHSRVARSNIYAHRTLGNKVTLVGPPTLAGQTYDLDRVLPEADVVMMLRVQFERMKEPFFPSVREYHRLFGLDADRMKRLKKGAIVLHPGPMNRDLEITTAAADSPQSKILDQVANGVYTRMAVLLRTFNAKLAHQER